MERRAFVAGTVALFAAPLAAGAQPAGKAARIGYLSLGSPPRHPLFRQSLHEIGYVESQNILIEWRFAQGKLEKLREYAADLVRLPVQAIVTAGPIATRTAKEVTTTIPIVMIFDNDPVEAGFVASLARPGGNVTGMAILTPELSAKRLELLKETLPGISRAGILYGPDEPATQTSLGRVRSVAEALRVQVEIFEARRVEDLDRTLRAATSARAEALVVLPAFATLNIERLVNLVAAHRLPVIYPDRRFTEVGGLMSYGPNERDFRRGAAIFIDKILKGAKPGDLPVEQPTKFELVINLKTAKALGLTIPQSVLLRADEVIQ